MNRNYLALGLVSALALGACSSNTDNTTTDVNNMGMASPMPTENADMGNAMSGMPASPGQVFADTAGASDWFEVEAGKLAQEKATAAGLKDFGAMMVTAHTESTAKLKAAGASASPAIAPNPALNAEQEANLAALQAATGGEFDALYKTQQIAAHEKTLAAMTDYAANGDVPELKQFAAAASTVVQGHLDKIKAL